MYYIPQAGRFQPQLKAEFMSVSLPKVLAEDLGPLPSFMSLK